MSNGMARKPKPCQLPRISRKDPSKYIVAPPEQIAKAKKRSKIEQHNEALELDKSMKEVWEE